MICSVEDCAKTVRARGLCSTHYTRMQVHGDPSVCLKPRVASVADEVCTIVGCVKSVRARGLCRAHYQAAYESTRGACEISGCTRPGHRRGLCSAHYARLRAYGDPMKGGPSRRVRGTGLPRRFYEKRRARALSNPSVETAEFAGIVLADPCVYCGAEAEHIDHIVPFAKLGDHDWSNVTGACARCNLQKSSREMLMFLLKREGR